MYNYGKVPTLPASLLLQISRVKCGKKASEVSRLSHQFDRAVSDGREFENGGELGSRWIAGGNELAEMLRERATLRGLANAGRSYPVLNPAEVGLFLQTV